MDMLDIVLVNLGVIKEFMVNTSSYLCKVSDLQSVVATTVLKHICEISNELSTF